MEKQGEKALSHALKVADVRHTKIPASRPHGKSPKRGSPIPESIEAGSIQADTRRKQNDSRTKAESLPVRLDSVDENRGMDQKRRSNKPGDLKKATRFIVFIGNLPYTATRESIGEHFQKVHPKWIRHCTEKDSGKSKGYAFLEFDGWDQMKTCLKLYHHSSFDDKQSPPRKINLELTAGGGGRGKERKTKLRAKNEKLDVERKRKVQEEGVQQDAPQERQSVVAKAYIHPSRRNRVASA